MENINYLKFTRTEMYFDYILQVKKLLHNKQLSTEDKLIAINELIETFYNKTKQ
jgi:hypothetical protein